MSIQSSSAAARLFAVLAVTAATIFVSTFARAQDASAFHQVETKYIFGNFTVGSSTGVEGEKAFEPETEANFGKGGGGRYGVSQTTIEYEFTPTQYMQIVLGRPSPITTSTAFQVPTTATWEQLTASRPNFAPC